MPPCDPPQKAEDNVSYRVSILVLVDAALRLDEFNLSLMRERIVSILVLVDAALRHRRIHIVRQIVHCGFQSLF